MAPYWKSRVTLLCLVSLLLPSVTMGAPIKPCSTQADWGDYTFAFPNGCTIGDKLFSDFYATSNIDRLPTVPTPVSSFDTAGFEFFFTLLDPAFSPTYAGPTETNSFAIAFRATVQPGGRSITGDLFSLTGVQVTGTGTIDASEVTCLSGTFPRPISSSPLCSSGQTAQAGTSAPQLSAIANFSPVEAVDVVISITLSGGPNGTARLNGLRLQVAEVPEPSTLVLLSSGVAALVLVLRRRKS
jgi:hypothetical protein